MLPFALASGVEDALMGKVIVMDRVDIDCPERVLSCRWWADWKEQQEYARFEEQQLIERRSHVIEIRIPGGVAYWHPTRVVVDEGAGALLDVGDE